MSCSSTCQPPQIFFTIFPFDKGLNYFSNFFPLNNTVLTHFRPYGNFNFMGQHKSRGQATSGTPLTTLSSVEFQPQWERNPPVEPCLRIWDCGAQDGTTRPLPWVRSKNPLGKKSNDDSFWAVPLK
ncbi:hypothetical protein G4B88_013892 [Cannabis sativa]|uniref:Uncharacterized protein n=1 Tax=Cannabis sativa TaxID=3483 RepID=A0A7J6I1Z2_CANSA|nr:hypothetical protein G4B88_013892 [Cannabis sativa]